MTIHDAIKSERFSHARFKPFCGQDRVLVYHRDETSPSGVRLAHINEAYTAAEADKLLREIRNTSALSPTEGFPNYAD